MAQPPIDPALARHAATAIVETLAAHGHLAYFAGGCVRDELLGHAPSDYDVATDATPDRLKSLFKRTNLVGAAFGVVLVSLDHAVVEVATFRSDGTYTDKRRPDAVTFSSPAEDAARRDFTVNALYLDPLARDRAKAAAESPLGGTVIDLVDGLRDVRARVIRAVGDPDRRLAEDHLRALRAVRLSSRLGFTIEDRTADAIRRHASSLVGVSAERIGDEIRRMMSHPSRAKAARRLSDLELDRSILRNHSLDGEPATLTGLPPTASFPLALSAWAVDLRLASPVPTAACPIFRRSLCLSNAEHEECRHILETWHDLIHIWPSAGVAQRKRIAGQNVMEAACVLLNQTHTKLAAAVATEHGRLSATPSGISPTPLVTGDDLIAAGIPAGPRYKQILDEIYDAQLEDRVVDRAQALELARRLGV
ncbi:MAG: CCA tRNA nucleotidyltransferase [Phycisphaerales bacterium]